MKRKIISIVLALALTVSLTACGKRNITIVKSLIEKNTMEAFKEYYNEYLEKNYKTDIAQYDIDYMTATHWDCIGKLVYFENQTMMIIADMVGVQDGDFIYNVRVLACEKGEVVEKYVVKDMFIWDDGFTYEVIDDALIFFTESYLISDDDKYDGVLYELKGGEVNTYYVDVDYSNGSYSASDYYDYLTGERVSVDEAVEKHTNINELPAYSYFFSDCVQELTENNYYGALTQEDFIKFLEYMDEKTSAMGIKNNQTIVRYYCGFLGYDLSGNDENSATETATEESTQEMTESPTEEIIEETTEATIEERTDEDGGDWDGAYRALINGFGEDIYGYSLIYVDSNQFPELILATDGGNCTQVYTFSNNKAELLYNSSNCYAEFSYAEQRGFICIPGMYHEALCYYLDNGDFSLYAHSEFPMGENGPDMDNPKYFLGETEISEQEFKDLLYRIDCLSTFEVYDTYDEAYNNR